MNDSRRIISTADGRKLGVSEAGQPDGVPVLVLRGSPHSRLLYDGWVEDAQSRGIRLIGYERPGYGASTPHRGRTVASAADDVAAIAEALGLNRLLIWGVSGGGPHALACAALLPGLVEAAAVLASLAPFPAEGLDYYVGMGETNVAETRAALESREACERVVEAETSELLRGDPEVMVRTWHSVLCPVDAAVLTTQFASFVLRSVHEGMGESRDGLVDDDVAFITPWGFELSQIHIPVLLMHGEHDRMVPVSHSKWLARRIPNVEALFLPEDGHLTLSVRRIPEVHAWLLSKM
ncbi:MAG TPA: alpha/beta hydrolase [Candidatus Limnocylindrales bacterium]|jgi:pimeloyl-ACP methyl ester carboxylesterase|nr:alpha/beta hydrolase [Candidatus Limnocylindrales bacterium]